MIKIQSKKGFIYFNMFQLLFKKLETYDHYKSITTVLQFKFQMNKTKTKRIITISPSSNQNKKGIPQRDSKVKPEPISFGISIQNKLAKQIHRISKINTDLNKSLTPIKPHQSSKHTRTSTSLKTTSKSKQSQGENNQDLQEHYQFGQRHQIICQTSNFKQQRSDYKPQSTSNLVKQNNIEAILLKINKNAQNSLEPSNPSLCLQKKMELSKLKSLLADGRQYIIKNKLLRNEDFVQEEHNINLEEIKQPIKVQIRNIFGRIRNKLDKRENQLYQELEEKLFQFKEKYCNKMYRISGLNNFIGKCEDDINKNYHKIVEQLEIQKFKEVIDIYSKRLMFYLDKIQQSYNVQLNLPVNIEENFKKQISNINITIQTKKNEKILDILGNKQIQNLRKSQIQPQHQRFNSTHKKSSLANPTFSISTKGLQNSQIGQFSPFLSSRKY